jgi:glutamate carboxypeptidase
MKSCLLAGLYAMRALQVEGFSDFEEITLFCSSDEETGSIYSSPVYEKEAKKADVVLVLESARENGDIVSSRKGIGNFIFEIQGQAAHAGVNPKRGVNAITEMGYLIINLDRKMQEMQQDYPGITINPGAINGGTKANVVPDLTRLEIDVRVTNTHEQKLAQDLLDKLTDNRVNPKTSIKRTGRFTRFPWTKTPATAFLVEQAIHVAEEIGIQLEDTATGGASDANIIAKLGIPVLDGLGPIGGNSHSSDEYVLKASIIPRTIMLTSLLKRIIKYREQILEANRTS